MILAIIKRIKYGPLTGEEEKVREERKRRKTKKKRADTDAELLVISS